MSFRFCHSQRCRYIEAHAVHKRLIELEDLWGERCTDEAKFSRVRMASEQRTRIVVSVFFSRVLDNKCIHRCASTYAGLILYVATNGGM